MLLCLHCFLLMASGVPGALKLSSPTISPSDAAWVHAALGYEAGGIYSGLYFGAYLLFPVASLYSQKPNQVIVSS